MDFSIDYLGLKLPHPIIAGVGLLVDDLDGVKRLEDVGVAVIVLWSLFEEQITREQISEVVHLDSYGESFVEAASYFPSLHAFALGFFQYLEQLRRAKEAVRIPVMASLNGATLGGWIDYVCQMQQAGVDALELNLYRIATDLEATSTDIECQVIETVHVVRKVVTIPVVVKVSPFYIAFVHFGRELDRVGVDGLVLFNRFYQFDIDLEDLTVTRTFYLSDFLELRLWLHWLAIFFGWVWVSLAVIGGVHTAIDVIKAMMVGVYVTQMVLVLFLYGFQYVRTVLNDLVEWMKEREWDSLAEMRGNLSLLKVSDLDAYEWVNYMLMLQSWRG